MGFRLIGLDSRQFDHLRGLDDGALAAAGAIRLTAAAGFPDRVSLADVPPGEPVLLLNYQHLPGPSAYRASGPIFVREQPCNQALVVDDIPADMRDRLYSVRAYSEAGWMLDAEVATGSHLPPLLDRLFSAGAAFLHLHHARRGCFACRVEPTASAGR